MEFSAVLRSVLQITALQGFERFGVEKERHEGYSSTEEEMVQEIDAYVKGV